MSIDQLVETFTFRAIKFEEDGEAYQHLQFLGSHGRLESPCTGAVPADVEFYPSGNVKSLKWRKDGKLHRENDQPALVVYADNSNWQIVQAVWKIHGQDHREGGLPSAIMVYEETDEVCLLEFCLHGEPYSADGLPTYIWIQPDGSLEDEGGHPIEADLSRFNGSLPRPPATEAPFFLKPR